MPRKYSDGQIGFALRQAEAGPPVEAICRKLGVAEALSGHKIRIVRQRPVRSDAGDLPESGARRRARAAVARAARLAAHVILISERSWRTAPCPFGYLGTMMR